MDSAPLSPDRPAPRRGRSRPASVLLACLFAAVPLTALASATAGLTLATTGAKTGPQQVQLAYRQVDAFRGLDQPALVVAADGNAIYVATRAGVEQRSQGGTVVGSTSTGALDELAVDTSGSIYGLAGRREVSKYAPGGSRVWSQMLSGTPLGFGNPERPPFVTGLAWDAAGNGLVAPYDLGLPLIGGSLFVAKRYAMGGGDLPPFPLSEDRDTYGDVAAAGGNVYLLNRTRSRVETYRNGAYTGAVSLPEPAERIAVGPDGSIYALSRRRWVYRLDATGTLLAVWEALDPEPSFDADSWATDLAVDGAGRVYVTDPNRGQVRVYDLDPDPDAEPPPPPAPPSVACQMVPDKFADPTRLRLGEQTQVTLRLGGGCPELAERADIMIVVDVSNSMAGEKIAAARDAVESFVLQMNLDRDQVGLVKFESSAQLLVGLTNNAPQVVGAAQTLSPNGGTNIVDGIDVALTELQGPRRRPDAKPIVVLMTDGMPTIVTGAATLAASDRARYLAAPTDCRFTDTCAVTLYTIGLGTDVDQDLLKIVATAPELFFYAPSADQLRSVYENVARRITAEFLLKTVTIVDHIPGNMDYVPDSAEPSAAYDAGARTLTWTFSQVAFGGQEMHYWLEPQEVGDWPTNVIAVYDGTDGLDNSQHGEFPIPRVVVIDDTPTPTASATVTTTPSPTPVTPTPSVTSQPTTQRPPSPVPTTPPPTVATDLPTATPTATPTPGITVTPPPSATPGAYKIYVVILFNDHCFKRYTDVSLVIDASTTMLRKNEFGHIKLDAAKEAAHAFINQLQLAPDSQGQSDHASIVWFNDTAAIEQPLTNDKADLDAAIDRIHAVEGSRINLGLQKGHQAVLDQERHMTANRPVLVLLSDGIPNRTSFEEIYAAADAAKEDGVRIYTVGHGMDVQAQALQRVASQPEYYFYSPTGDELASIYREIAGQIICR